MRIEVYDGNGNLVEVEEAPDRPLFGVEVLATLLAVTGALTVEDAANAVGQTPDALIAEAEAWGIAAKIKEK